MEKSMEIEYSDIIMVRKLSISLFKLTFDM